MMEGIITEFAKNEIQSVVNFVKGEARYLCCFSSYAATFDKKKEELEAKLQDINRKIEKDRGVSIVTYEARQWTREAESLMNIDIGKEKCSNDKCLNCWQQYWKGKDLEEKTQQIDRLLERCNFGIVSDVADLPGINFHSLQNFIQFESRESTFQNLKKALEDENCNVIGLHGLGGTGKTSMAIQLGANTEGSRFDKVIFLVVSQPPNFRKIRHELAKHVDLALQEGEEEEHSKMIWHKITNMKEKKLLIILDDVWEEFDLKQHLGIPFSHQHKGCNVLVTTRNSQVCISMGCHAIQIHTLTDKDALNLFLAHAGNCDTSTGLTGMPQKIVKHCGGVPVAIVAIAKALKHRPLSVWKDALETLEGHHVIPNMKDAYKCLKLSYDNLENQIAKDLLLISSLFPEDSEILIDMLVKIGIGLGPFYENDEYNLRRSEVRGAIMELIYSSLLLNSEEECVKMHDLVREVALWIGENDIQCHMDVEEPIKGNLRYLYCKHNGFPDKFNGNKLEALLIFLNESKDLNVSDTFFQEMKSLKVFILVNEGRVPALSLTYSLQHLKDIRTLILVKLELDDMSIFGNLLSLESLWLHRCSINEFPREFLKLKKLRSLELERCEIKKNNPFEVIEKCSQLEELAFVGNECADKEMDAISHNGSPLTLQRYRIHSTRHLSSYFYNYSSASRCFQIDELRHLISEATFKQLVLRADLLILEGEDAERIWNNLFHDIVAINEGGMMNDLITLQLSDAPNIPCLIETKNYNSDVTFLRNLEELNLSAMGIVDLCQGPPPPGFLEQIVIMELKKCEKLRRIFSNGYYNLCHLKSMILENCPMLTSIFPPSIVPSLMQLEELIVRRCDALEYIIECENGDNNQKSHYNSSFKSLKKMELSSVPSLMGIFRDNRQFMINASSQKSSPPISRYKSNKANQSTATNAFSWVKACCSLSKSRQQASKETDIKVSEHRLLGNTNPLEIDASINGVPFLAAQSLLVQSLENVREIKLYRCDNIISLSTLSLATSTISLENLTIRHCCNLKCITTCGRDDAQVGQNYDCSIFPKLQKLEIAYCFGLEFLFVLPASGCLERLNSLTISNVPELMYVVGRYGKEQHSSNQNNQNNDLHFDLLALETLYIQNAPKINGICPKNYKLLLSSSLQNVGMQYFGIKSFIDYNMVNGTTTKESHTSTNGSAPLCYASQILLNQSFKNIRKMELVHCQKLISLLTLSIASTILLEELTITSCHRLKCIVADEGDVGTDVNYNSIFPKLKQLQVSYCLALEYLFPSNAFRSLYLESAYIYEAPVLKYVFGGSQHEQRLTRENQNIKTHFNFPVLEHLSITGVPKHVSIHLNNYYLKGWLSLRTIFFERHALDEELSELFTEEERKTLESLVVDEVILDLTYMETEKNRDGLEPLTPILQELRLQHISELLTLCVGPKRIIYFHNLQDLCIVECEKIKVIFSISIVRSLPMLTRIYVTDCEELVHIVEEDYGMNVDEHLCHEPCFPNLSVVRVLRCDKLKHLFSITASDNLPELMELEISESNELEHVLIRRGEMKEMVMKDVLPGLMVMELNQLPNLISVCHGIDFQTLKEKKHARIYDCPKFSFLETSTAQLQAGLETAGSDVEEKAEKISSHQYLNMGEATQQSFMEVAIHTSPNLTVLPTRDNTNASAKIIEVDEEEEEEEEGALITSRRPRSGTKAGSSLSKEKFENSVYGDPFMLPVTTISTEQTFEAVLPLSPSSILLKPSDEITTTPDGSKNQDSRGSVEKEQKLSCHSNGRQALETQQLTTGSANITRGSMEDAKEIVEQGIIFEKPKVTNISSAYPNVTGQSEIQEATEGIVEDNFVPETTKMTASSDSKLTGQQEGLVYKDGGKETNRMDHDSIGGETRLEIQSTESINIVEVRAGECTSLETQHPSSSTSKEPIHVSPKPTMLPSSPCATTKTFEEEKKGGLITTHTYPVPKTSSEQATETIPPFSTIPTKALTSPKRTPMSTYGGNILENAGTTDSHLQEALGAIQITSQLSESSSSDMAPSVHDTNNALSTVWAKEIVDMMKLEGDEPSMLVEAFKTNPHLRLSLEDRSTDLLCYSYKVLLNILSVLATKSPFTITEADKRLLTKYLKDASVLGFDRDWLESIRIKVFNCDTSEVHHKQQVLKSLDNKIQANKIELANVLDQEAKAAQSVEMAQKELEATHKEFEAAYKGLEAAHSHFNVAQQEHTDLRTRHSQLLEEFQEILKQRDQCSEIVAAKLMPFGF